MKVLEALKQKRAETLAGKDLEYEVLFPTEINFALIKNRHN